METRQVVIIGAGPGGLCTAIKLKEAGIDDFVILEKADGVGGTWWHNRYPGAECDVQSHLYSFSFEIKPDWSRPYAGQQEILDYLNQVADKYGLRPRIRFGQEVTAARWDDEHAHWHLTTASGEQLASRVVVSAMGMFNEPAYPGIPGLDGFAGKCFHSARWDHDHDLTGRSVAVIGSAASAVQFIPEIAPSVGQLYIYQRTANWVLPKADQPFSEAQLDEFRRNPESVNRLRAQIYEDLDNFITFSNPETLKAAEAAGLENIAVVEDPELREKLVPTHPFGCKRPLASNVYYPVFNRPNVELITEPIEHITADAIVTADGGVRQPDTLILATGFHTGQYLSAIDVTGRNGMRLQDAWQDGAMAYLGMTTSGFPNLFMLYGPNTNNGSIIYMLERQVDYVIRQLRRLAEEGLQWMDVRPGAMASYNDEIQRAIDRVEVWQASCSGYYRAPSGRVVTQWPYTMDEFTRRTASDDRDVFEVA